MGQTKSKAAFTVIRIAIILILAVFLLAAVAVGVLQGTFSSSRVTAAVAKGGVLDLRGQAQMGRPIHLEGDWEYYPNVFQTGDRFLPQLLQGAAAQLVSFPLDDVSHAAGPATYRLLLQTDQPISGYAFYLENYNEDFAIYVNGSKVPPIWGGPQEKLLYTLSDYLFRIEAPVEPGAVELIISANSSPDQAVLYRNNLLFGPADDVVDHVAQVWRDDTFLIGIILVMVSIGLIFMLIRTRFDMLASLTFFDTFLAIRILLGYSVATYFIHGLLPFLRLGRLDFVGLQYVAFFISGNFGCLLSASIFDPKRRLPSWPIYVQIGICSVSALFTLFFYSRCPAVCMWLLFLVLAGSFLIVTWHVWHILREKRLNAHYLFQMIKTYYIGAVMGLDILLLHGETNNALVYAYVLFFFAHLSARLMDSNASYQEVETLNRNLEQIIEERTSELVETNRSLSELSVRDPLTQAHNRLFFEEAMEDTIRNHAGEPIYLCMFDLDYFKTINDRFGHAAGDEQLKFVVKTVNHILDGCATLFRVGGEEFIVLFQGVSREYVLSLLEQIRRQLEADAKANPKRTTASFGLVQYHQGDTSKSLLSKVDKCLYSAKKMGRNCLVIG